MLIINLMQHYDNDMKIFFMYVVSTDVNMWFH